MHFLRWVFLSNVFCLVCQPIFALDLDQESLLRCRQAIDVLRGEGLLAWASGAQGQLDEYEWLRAAKENPEPTPLNMTLEQLRLGEEIIALLRATEPVINDAADLVSHDRGVLTTTYGLSSEQVTSLEERLLEARLRLRWREYVKAELYPYPVDRLHNVGLSWQFIDALSFEGLRTVQAVAEASDDRLIHVKNLGLSGLKKVKEALRQVGLYTNGRSLKR
jgi:hypothetical protein